MKKDRINLNDRQLEMLKMIHVLSAEKDFMIVEQLLKFLLQFTYKTESAARMAMKELEELGMIKKIEKETTNYKHVFLTYKGALYLGFDQKKKPAYYPLTEDVMARRLEYIFDIAKRSRASDFDRFVSGMNDKYLSTLLQKAGYVAGLEYSEKVRRLYEKGTDMYNRKSWVLYHHEQSLIWGKGLLIKNLKGSPVKINEDADTANVVGLHKKNIYLAIRKQSSEGDFFYNKYVKFLNFKVPYTFKKLMKDLVYLHGFNRVFPDSTKIKFEIIAQSEAEKSIIESNLKLIAFENPEQEQVYELWQNAISVSVIDIDHYLLRKDKYDAS